MSRKNSTVKAHSSPHVIRLEGDQRAMSDALLANDQFVPSMNTGTGKPALMSSRGFQLDLVVARPGCFGDFIPAAVI